MKEIMISIKPKWVEKILNGKKNIEIRKTMPKCSLPCKVYIYCTQPKKYWAFSNWGATSDELVWKMKDKVKMCNGLEVWDDDCEKLNSKVVAEFTLNKVTKHDKNFIDFEGNICYNFKVCDVKNAGFDRDVFSLLDFDDFIENYGKGKTLYGWHIDNLKIYDKPKELSEFICRKPLKRPPQSWCYVEKVGK